jgi:acetyl-CoA carboxylase biotin carboxyl carrier protein
MEDVDDILRVLDSSDYDELHIDTGRFVLTLRREAGGWTQEHEVRAEHEVPTRPGPETDTAPESEVVRSTATAPRIGGLQEGASSESLRAVVSPLPGVFYRAPKPGAAPFVEVGDNVEPDTVVCILETMKLMNAILAGADGTVAEICLGNGEPAERDTVLMWVRPYSA